MVAFVGCKWLLESLVFFFCKSIIVLLEIIRFPQKKTKYQFQKGRNLIQEETTGIKCFEFLKKFQDDKI